MMAYLAGILLDEDSTVARACRLLRARNFQYRDAVLRWLFCLAAARLHQFVNAGDITFPRLFAGYLLGRRQGISKRLLSFRGSS